jgi:hypothetical protein
LRLLIAVAHDYVAIDKNQKKSQKNKRRIFILYFAISLLTETHSYHINMIDDSEKVNNVIKNIDTIYKQVKANEISPNDDYLFKDIKQTNLSKTIERLEKMDSLNSVFVPRI